ncbi:MAG: DMT family transporter [Chloroflexi bacterium]|nr:DMT family transporter [Chloroflexota bacterium]
MSYLIPFIYVILAAVLFGASAPVAKLFLTEVKPLPMAAFLYLGSGTGLIIFKIISKIAGRKKNTEASLRKKDIPFLIGAIVAGGIAGPVLLMMGLRVTPASTASLLLNMEAVATALIAAALFREAVGRRVWAAVGIITASSIILTLDINGGWGFAPGALAIIGACILWGLDNNLTGCISSRDPVQVVLTKGIFAGTFSLLLAFCFKDPIPSASVVAGIMILGFFSYGLSIVFFVLAMRHIGAARVGALFGTAPFIGAILSFIIFRNTPDIFFLIAMPFMVIGAVLLLTEKHSHNHVHTACFHDHGHNHDDSHHEHEHPDEDIPIDSYHSHSHSHEIFSHEHSHLPDLHHRHEHD